MKGQINVSLGEVNDLDMGKGWQEGHLDDVQVLQYKINSSIYQVTMGISQR
jgi:hypothetical protein